MNQSHAQTLSMGWSGFTETIIITRQLKSSKGVQLVRSVCAKIPLAKVRRRNGMNLSCQYSNIGKFLNNGPGTYTQTHIMMTNWLKKIQDIWGQYLCLTMWSGEETQ